MKRLIEKSKVISTAVSLGLFCLLALSGCENKQPGPSGAKQILSVTGEVKTPMDLSLSELVQMGSLYIKDVLLIKEKTGCTGPEELISGSSYRGILLKDILLKAGMKFTRKWEPGVFIRVKGSNQEDVVFSFGEIFYSSIGRSVLIAYEQNSRPMDFKNGAGSLIVTTDVRAGRFIAEVREVIVERVNVVMKAYDDKKEKIVRTATSELIISDHQTQQTTKITLQSLLQFPVIRLPFAVMAGDCEGFRGIYAFEGTLLKDILIPAGVNPCRPDYRRYALVSSEDGFCATFSMGELFNSRLNNNIMIAYKRDGNILNASDGFAMSVVGEDNLGGRSVKRIQRIEIF